MPEIGEVARIVHFIREYLVGKTLAVVKAQHDENVFGKVGTSAAEFEKALTGKKILDAKQQGKYFWMEMSSPPHPLCHFGMAGWFEIKGVETAYYKPTKAINDEWPPKYWKFSFETKEEPGKPVVEAAFVDFRRFARVRLVDCPAEDLRKTTPLKENGPDPVIDENILTVGWLADLCAKKRLPIKALLLDQANISGIGNWVGDEIMYDARIHPEQYSNTLSTLQIQQLHASLHCVCSLAVATKADSRQFPKTWLFKHRWGKGKKDSANRLPNGAKIVFLKVGGRTSAVIPSVQKKTGAVAGDVKKEDRMDSETDGDLHDGSPGGEKKKPAKVKRSTKRAETEESEVKAEPKPAEKVTERPSRARKADAAVKGISAAATNGAATKGKKRKTAAKQEPDVTEVEEVVAAAEPVAARNGDGEGEPELPPTKKQKLSTKASSKVPDRTRKPQAAKAKTKSAIAATGASDGRRRSARVSGVGARRYDEG